MSLPLPIRSVAYPRYSSARLAAAARDCFAITITCSPSSASRRTLRSAALESTALPTTGLGAGTRTPEAVEPELDPEQAMAASATIQNRAQKRAILTATFVLPLFDLAGVVAGPRVEPVLLPFLWP